jgi:hypothetical protein
MENKLLLFPFWIAVLWTLCVSSPSNSKIDSANTKNKTYAQCLIGVGKFNFPDFKSGSIWDFKYDSTSYCPPLNDRLGLLMSASVRFYEKAHFFSEIGINFFYSDVNFPRRENKSCDGGISLLKIFFPWGIGYFYQYKFLEFSTQFDFAFDFGLTDHEKITSPFSGYNSIGFGLRGCIQILFLINQSLGIPIRIGYGKSASSHLTGVLGSESNKTQEYYGFYFSSGMTFDIYALSPYLWW